MANKAKMDSEPEETAPHLTDARFRQNFEVMRYSGEMCDIEIKVEDIKFKGNFYFLNGYL